MTALLGVTPGKGPEPEVGAVGLGQILPWTELGCSLQSPGSSPIIMHQQQQNHRVQ